MAMRSSERWPVMLSSEGRLTNNRYRQRINE